MVNERLMIAPWRTALLIALLFAAFGACYWQTITGLFHVWTTNEDYSYAFLIPFMSGYLIWERRQEFRRTPFSTNWLGGILFVFFILVSAYGILGSSPSAVRPAIPLIILAITLFCFGKQIFKIMLFPLALLIFMIPLPTMYGTLVGVHLKRISTLLGELILRLAGITVFVEGNVIDLGVTQLQVVDACSGLRYVLPLLCVGVIFAYFFEKVRWRQVVIAVSTMPIAIITNGIRIGATGILAERYGSDVAHGFFHGFSGWLIFVFAFALLFVVHFILKLIFGKTPSHKASNPGERKKTDKIQFKNNTLPVGITCAFLLLVSVLGHTTAALPDIKIRRGLSSFPLTINKWKGQSANIDPEIISASGAEEAFSATYRDGPGDSYSLYIGYRGSPFLESANFFHSPYVCLPSGGWKTLHIARHSISDVPKFGTITVQKMISQKMGQKQLVYYWFQTKSRTSFDVNINRFHLAWHAIQRDNTHDLFIRPITPLQPNETTAQAEARMDQFVRDMMAVLLKFLETNLVEGST
jgi:exosortase D (VPLPA-CTERM-specific)